MMLQSFKKLPFKQNRIFDIFKNTSIRTFSNGDKSGFSLDQDEYVNTEEMTKNQK